MVTKEYSKYEQTTKGIGANLDFMKIYDRSFSLKIRAIGFYFWAKGKIMGRIIFKKLSILHVTKKEK